MEFDTDPKMMRAIHTGLNGRREETRPPFVERRGTITIDSVHRASDPESHRKAVGAWAESVWEAWAQYHELARTLLQEMLVATRDHGHRA